MAMDRVRSKNVSILKQGRSGCQKILLPTLLGYVLSMMAGTVRAESMCGALVSPFGYACNDYIIQTTDGFLLGMSNIPYGRAGNSASLGEPVLLFHGFQAGADNFFWNSPEESLGFVFADLGYDVWIGNNRNVQWSSGNTKYGYNDTEYWDWTWDELALYDVTASIDFVYNRRGGTPIFYVGHSQGTMILFAALTNTVQQTAQIRSKLRAIVLLAPFIYNSYIDAPLNKLLLSNFANQIPPMLGVGPLDPKSMVDMVCNNSTTDCLNLIEGLLGQDSYLNSSRFPYYLRFFPQVTSLKNYNHYGQVRSTGIFQKYDKGMMNNLIAYGQATPPPYDLSIFPTDLPMQVFTGGIDGLADPTDAQHLLSALPASSLREVHTFADYGHLDFILGTRANVDIYPLMNSFLATH